MITWLFDNRNQYGYLPNLIKDMTLQPGTDAWHDLCIKQPYSYEFRFLKYCILDKVPFKCAMANSDIYEAPAYYPVNLNFFDTNIDYFSLMAPDSLTKLKQGRFKFLFYYSEGDDISISGIDYTLANLMNKHGISPENVVFITANAKIDGKYPYFFFPDDELYYRLLHLRQKDWVKTVGLGPRPYKLTYLNRADKIWRRILASRLYHLGCLKDAQFSYSNYKYQTSSIEEDKIENYDDGYLDNLENIYDSFSMQMPFSCDEMTIDQHNNHKIIHLPHFTDSYWQLIAETHFRQDTIFLTEKTFKCILNLQPFVIAGSPYSLKLLKHLGYKTFKNVIKETYDNIDDSAKRMHEILNVVYSLNNRPDADHQQIMGMLKETLEYNQKTFLAPKVGRLQGLLQRLDYK